MRKQGNKKRSGFTMLELLMVLTAIAAISMLVFGGYRKIHGYVNKTSAEVMVDKLNDAIGVWLSLQMRAGNFGKKASDLGGDVDDAYAELIKSISIDGQEVDVGLPTKLTLEKVKGMGIKFSDGEFKL